MNSNTHDKKFLNIAYKTFCFILLFIMAFIVFIQFAYSNLNTNVLETLVYTCLIFIPLFIIGYLGTKSINANNCKRKNLKLVILFSTLTLVFLGAILVANFRSGDYNVYLKVWYDAYTNVSFKDALGKILTTSNYAPVYNYFLIIFAQLGIPALLGIKYLTFLFSLLLAYAITKIVCFIKKEKFNFILFSIVMIVPMIFIEYTSWGQCDAIYTSLALLGLYFALNKRSKTAFLFVGLSFAFKLQVLFIVPVMFMLLIMKDSNGEKHLKWKDIWIVPCVYLINLLPIISGESIIKLLTFYVSQTSYYNALSMGCPNLCAIIQSAQDILVNNPQASYSVWLVLTIALTAIILICLLIHFYKKYNNNLTNENIVKIALVFSFVMVFFMPKMHERFYFIPASLSIIYMLINPNKLSIASCLTINASITIAMSLFLFSIKPYILKVIVSILPTLLMSTALILIAVLTFKDCNKADEKKQI